MQGRGPERQPRRTCWSTVHKRRASNRGRCADFSLEEFIITEQSNNGGFLFDRFFFQHYSLLAYPDTPPY